MNGAVTYGSRVADSKDTREFRSSSHILSGCRFWSNVCCLPVSNTESFPYSHAVMYIYSVICMWEDFPDLCTKSCRRLKTNTNIFPLISTVIE